MIPADSIKQKAQELSDNFIEVRRYLHQHPELSYQEFETAKFVRQQLEKLGIQNTVTKAKTGLVAVIEGKNPHKKTIALRADMDALPIQEENDVPYRSKNEGVMHACGHDVHMACVLGAAKLLVDFKDEWEGTVKLIFQPGEEKNPGGASLMIADGALLEPVPSHIFGQHVMPFIPTGQVGFRPGKYMASADEIYLTVKGVSGHAALPDRTVDPIIIASHIITALQQVVSRKADPRKPTVLTFGSIHGGHAQNVIPSEVKIAGTFRALDEKWRFEAHQHIKDMAEGIAKGMGGSCDVNIDVGYPYLKNDEAATFRARQAAESYLGKGNVQDLDLWLGAEDFAYYSHEIPACFYRLGTGNAKKDTERGVHTPKFNVDEDAIALGMGLMAWLAINELAHT